MKDFELINDTFVIKNYDKKAPFCSFLPGLAGVCGIPLWSFYVNRGQCITSFGVDNKENPIMEFFPANIAYENTSTKGFRTLVRKNNKIFEPFFSQSAKNSKRDMFIKQNSFSICETDLENSLKTNVEYFILPEENFGAVVREVTFENLGEKAEIEILDGIPRIIPYGVSGSDFSRMANLMRSYNTMSNLENKIPMFFNEIKGDDDDEVGTNVGGYYYMSFDKDGLITPVYDPVAIFGEDTSLITPVKFSDEGLKGVLQYKQHSTNKICCCFTPKRIVLEKNNKYKISTLIGFSHSPEFINDVAKRVVKPNYLHEKLKIADLLADRFTSDIETTTSDKMLDMYFRQCYLDNFLRGGYPFAFEGDKIVHLFSRKHGDPERDYNYFSTAAEFYSQGDGNFRDVCQNRRNDVIFHPECKDFNILMFYSLMQFDGYNPLVVKGTTFSLISEKQNEANDIVDQYVSNNKEVIKKLISTDFTAGGLINGVYSANAILSIDDNDFLNMIIKLCNQNIEASTDKFGNWSDHFDYNLDLIENYLKVYPDKLSELLFDNKNYTYFDSDLFVRPRAQKYVFNGKDARQYTAFEIVNEKYERGYIKNGTNWLKTSDGKVYKTNLFEKLFSICVNKFALLDPCQMGIEMEAGRAGWCDATSGLPGMFGSGMSETFELKRVLEFIKDCSTKFNDKIIEIPVELYDFYKNINNIFDKNLSEFDYWDNISNERELFREKIKFNISGDLKTLSLSDIKVISEKWIGKLEIGIEKALKFGDGFCPTYIKYEAVKFDILDTKSGNYNNVRVTEFVPKALPKFLEGPAKQLKDADNKTESVKIINEVKKSDVYDKKLKMYKTSESLLNESLELGRIKAFTPGWQENESVFLHMEYKFLLAMLTSGLYETFFNEIKNVFIPYLDPTVYGRSTLENCSFLASSANPDENLHGRGFVSRLSGSTTEVVSIWTEMFLGKTPFVYENGNLGIRIKPIIPEWLFDENGEISYRFLTNSKIILHNPNRKSTFEAEIYMIKIGDEIIYGDTIYGDRAKKIRNGEKSEIDIYFK